MADLYEDLVKDLEEIIAMKTGNLELEEVPNMSAKTYAPKILCEENDVWQKKNNCTMMHKVKTPESNFRGFCN